MAIAPAPPRADSATPDATPSGVERYRGPIIVGSIVIAWAWAVFVASHLDLPLSIRKPALFVHLVALVVGFGAVLITDLFGLLWLLKRKSLTDVLGVLDVLHLVIWAGLEVLVISGMLLAPDISSTRVQVKMVLVLVAALNGLWASRLSSELRLTGVGVVPRPLMVRIFVAAMISQTAWWGSTLVGFISANIDKT